MFWPFNLKLGAQLTTYAGMFLAISAGIAWLREDAKKDALAEVRAEMQVQLDAARAEALLKAQKLEFVTKVLKGTEDEAARLSGENQALLEKQRETVPLSEACNTCRIPNDRLWLRERPKGASVSRKAGGS